MREDLMAIIDIAVDIERNEVDMLQVREHGGNCQAHLFARQVLQQELKTAIDSFVKEYQPPAFPF